MEAGDGGAGKIEGRAGGRPTPMDIALDAAQKTSGIGILLLSGCFWLPSNCFAVW